MQTFLYNVLDQLMAEQATPLQKTTFVLPSKRAGAFLKHLLKTKTDYTGFTPQIWSVEDFITSITGLKTLDNTNTLFRFYETYKSLTPQNEQEDFDTFYGWAQTLIYDFNEIDRYLIDTAKFFSYLADIQNIEHWSLQKPQTDLVQNYLRFWNQLPNYHRQFVQTILKDKEAYQGLVYRKAAEQISEYLQQTDHHLIFIGFNALNNAEQHIIQTVLDEERGRIFWDIDQHFFDDYNHEAGLFIRQYYKKWPYYADKKNELEWVGRHFGAPKHIESIGVSKNIGQAKYVGEILEKEGVKHTAVVLNDEKLLSPVLNALPSSVDKLNITMGQPLEMTPPASLFELLFKIQLTNQGNLYYKDVLDVLSHPAIKQALADTAEEMQRDITDKNHVFIAKADIIAHVQGADKAVLNNCFSDYKNNLHGFLDALIALTEQLRPSSKESSALETEYLFHFNKLFKKLKNLLEKYNALTTIKALHRIYGDLLKTESLDFSGSPFDGLQIMGMLETRVLDYETVILTSVNEGVLPAGKSSHSFIPYDLKKAYGLPTYKEKDAVYTYHFYRLLQRAKNIYLLYNTEKSGFNAGEKSRFITQLAVENLRQHEFTQKLISPKVQASHQALREIEKTSEMLKVLRQKAQKGFSPSALTTYIRNPLDFYKKYVLGIQESDEVEETVAYNTLGTVVHNTLEKFYKPYVGKSLNETDVDTMFKHIDNEIKIQFKEVYADAPLTQGKNLIVYEVAKRYVSNFLHHEKKLITSKNQELNILHIESDEFTQRLNIPELEFPVSLRGKIDRVDRLHNQIRVVDYKTGNIEKSDLSLKNWEELTTDYKYSKAFQVLCYASILQNQEQYASLQAGIISFKNMKTGFMPFTDKSHKKTTKIDANVLALFHDQLKNLIIEIFDPAIPFKEKDTQAC